MGLESYSHFESGSGSAWVQWTYQYDAAGQLLTDGEDSYRYDELGRLEQVTAKRLNSGTMKADPDPARIVTQSFAYDAFGNQVQSSATGAIPPTGGAGSNFNSFTFTGAELASMALTNRLPSTANGLPTGAQYDAQGNLTRIYQQASDVNNPALWMAYDALGRVTELKDQKRNLREVYQYTADGLRTVVYTYEGLQPGGALVKALVNIYNDQHQLVSQYDWVLE